MIFPPTDWGDFYEEEYQPESPGSSLHFQRWFWNPVALAQGAHGAPRNEGRSLDTHMGVITVTNTTAAGFAPIDRYELVRASLFSSAGIFSGRTFQARFSNDGGSTWGSWQDIGAGWPTNTELGGFGEFRINLRTGAARLTFLGPGGDGFVMVLRTATLTPLSGCNGVQFRWNTSGASVDMDCYCLGGLTA